MEELLEYYINDYTIFEATLRRDFCEVTGILTENGNKNFFVTIWEKIIELLELAKRKINEIVDKFILSWEKFRAGSELISTVYRLKRYLHYFYTQELVECLSDMTISNFKSFNYLFVDKIIPINNIIDNLSFDISEQEMKKQIESLPNKEKIIKIIKEKAWEKDYEEKPFKNNSASTRDFIFHFLLKKPELIYDIKELKINLTRKLDRKKDEANKLLKKYKKDSDMTKKYKESNINNSTTNNNESIKYIIQKEESKVVEDLYDHKQYMEKIHTYLKLISSVKSVTIIYISCIIKEINKMRKEAFRLYNTAGKYITNYIREEIKKDPSKKKKYKDLFDDFYKQAAGYQNESYISDEYINALSEATIYELEF